jgi:hypothetical protein
MQGTVMTEAGVASAVRDLRHPGGLTATGYRGTDEECVAHIQRW